MRQNMKRVTPKKSVSRQRGFTLIEMMVAILMIMVGLVAVAQLVAASVSLDAADRNDSTAVVLAQNELNQFAARPLSDITYTDTFGNLCTVSGAVGAFAGNQVTTFANRQIIDYTRAAVPGYSFIWSDPNDPASARYDVRWAVFTLPGGSGKRFIVGARKTGGNRPFLPVTLDTLVSK
jgi:prepilin-type N-terminal cleavage/methylation domain-containing protein